MNEINYNRGLPVKYKIDVLVVGGGPAGCAAATMCARQEYVENGAVTHPSVLLIEQSGTFGGAGILEMVSEIMNFDDGINFLAGGFGREIHDRLFGECKYKRDWYTVKPEPLKRLYDELVTSAGVKTLFYTHLVDIITTEDKTEKRVKYAVVSAPDGMFAIQADCFIDCTGSGSLCDLAGAESCYGNDKGIAMSTTLCSLWGGIDFSKLRNQGARLAEAIETGVLPQYDMVLPGLKSMYPDLGIAGGNIGHCFNVDDRSAESLTQAMFFGRKLLASYEEYYRGYVEGCDKATLLQSAAYLGIRESRRIICSYTLTIDSFYKDEPFEDEIGRYSYPIDIHPLTSDHNGMKEFSKSVSKRHTNGHSYSIPYRCLVPKGFVNLLVAGRCVGTDHEMEASIRVIPGCYITGQAAGIAAAMSVFHNCDTDKLDIAELQKRLAKAGAFLAK